MVIMVQHAGVAVHKQSRTVVAVLECIWTPGISASDVDASTTVRNQA
jgi:hypothetical protein